MFCVLHQCFTEKISKSVPHNPADPITLSEAIKLDKELQAQTENDPDVDKFCLESFWGVTYCSLFTLHFIIKYFYDSKFYNNK